MIHRSTIQLLRFHFSFFLMPVYWFALSQVVRPNAGRALLIFILLHILIYPSSNGFNSYMDRDEGSIGGLKSPLRPTLQLLYASLIMDGLALLLGFFISIYFTLAAGLYILASRAYSARSVRLKKYPIAGYLTVIICQGALVFFMVYHGTDPSLSLNAPTLGMISASLLIGGFYPLTQIYQHAADAKDGVRTISALLGIRGTFKFCGIMYAIVFVFLAYFFLDSLEIKEFLDFFNLYAACTRILYKMGRTSLAKSFFGRLQTYHENEYRCFLFYQYRLYSCISNERALHALN